MKRVFKKIAAWAVTLAIVLQLMPLNLLAASAPDTRVTDPATMTDWQRWFGASVLNTENAGGVWGDKSVFTGVDAFNAALEDGVADYDIEMTENGQNFLVALSAIAANKSIVGYSALPTDTMLVLDLSNSMSNTAMTNMIGAANAAMTKLLALNLHNRVGVVVYSGDSNGNGNSASHLDRSATVLLPIDRYTGTGRDQNVFLNYENDTVSVARGVLPAGSTLPSKRANGATYIQAGMQLAVDEFKAIDKADTVIQSGPQAGTVRMPIMVLMSDGAPTVATTSINNVDTSTHGNGSASNTTQSYLTQLTCAWAKKEMTDHYSRAALFYTLGLNVGTSADAQAVLNPAGAGNPYQQYWTAYQAATGNTITQGNNRTFTVPVVKNLDRVYVDQYFPASGDNALLNAFQSIVNQIIIQSKYYPTLVDDGKHHLNGYITFHDELGEYMEVKDVKGLTVDGHYYKGSAIVKALKNGDFGNIYGGNLANMNTDGLAFLQAVEERLGCTEAQAGEIVAQALKDGQLYYNSDTDFSNYIGWYADENGAFLGYWNGKHTHTDKPVGAVYANRSYGFMGTVGSAEEFNESDMLHISVQVREHVEKKHQMVIYKVPAALIPTVNYEINFEGTDLETGTNFEMSVKGATEALRLVFEVGLRSDINRINVAQKVTNYPHVQDGVYTFYSNSWKEHTHTDGSLVDDHDATWLEFEPSYENERYYFTANTPIYESNGDGTYRLINYDPATKPGTVFYNCAIRFSTHSTVMTAAVKEEHFVPISAQALAEAAEAADGSWYIPKGTLHRLLEDAEGHEYQTPKAGENLLTPEKEHPTKTLDYSNHPKVVTLPDGSVHADACLGNNGLFTLTAAQGLKLSKTMAVAGLGAGETFAFEITLSPLPGTVLATSYPLYDADGNYLRDVAVNGNVAEVSLAPDEVVYLADLPVGTQYAVREILPINSPYMEDVTATIGKTGTVQAGQFGNVHFVNTLVSHGNLILHKDVMLDAALGADATYTAPFDVLVTFDSKSFDTVTVDGVDTPVVDGKLSLTIRDDQAIVIGKIPANVTASVSEPNLGLGWASDISPATVTVSDTTDTVVTLKNTYTVGGVYPINIAHTGVKTINGRPWLASDNFDFGFQYFDGNQWVDYHGTKVVTGMSAEHTFSFTDALNQFVSDKVNAVGVYQLRVYELPDDIDGINYDIYPKRFELTVENDYATGKLKITNVTTVTPPAAADRPGTTVKNENGDWHVTTLFENIYQVAGTAEVVIDVIKELTDSTGLDHTKAGFEFELYERDANNQKINVRSIGTTDANGNLTYRFSFDANTKGNTFTYYLAEKGLGEDGMTYDMTEHKIEVTIVDNLDGSVSAHVNGTNGNIYAATFLNTYALDEATLTVSGNKKLTGRDPLATDRFTFELYETDANFQNGVKKDTAENGGGAFALTDTIAKAGTYYYTVLESASGIGGITDDKSVYKLTVKVEKGDGASLKATITDMVKDESDADSVEFDNIYKATGSTSVTINVTKEMDDDTGVGRGKADFEFELYQLEGGQKVNVTNIGKTDASGKLTFVKTWTADDVGKTFTYYLAEVDKGEEGMTYDTTPREIKVEIVDNLDATVYAKVNGLKADTYGAMFQNVYRLDAATLTVSGNKTLTGRDPLATDKFTFELYETDANFENGVKKDTAENGGGAFTLTDTIAKAGTYYYTVSEVASGIAGVTDDKAVYYLTVEVDKGNGGTLEANVVGMLKGTQPVSAVTFDNRYEAKGDTDVTINVTKEMDDNTGVGRGKADFEFELYQLDGNNQKVAVTDIGKTDENGNLTFMRTFGEELIGHTMTFYLAEKDLGEDGVTYDTTPREVKIEIVDNLDGTAYAKVNGEKTATYAAAFRNTYRLDAATLTVDGNKKVTGRDPLATDKFTFELYETDANFENGVKKDIAENGGGAFTLTDSIAKAGTYYYTVVETASGIAGITDDKSVYQLTVKVEKGDGATLKATVTSVKKNADDADAVEFDNLYTVNPNEHVIKGDKTLNGRDIVNGEFSFVLKDKDGTVLQTKTVKDGKFAFDALTFDKVGTYVYTVSEVKGEAEGVTYDQTVYTVTLTVTDRLDGTLAIAEVITVDGKAADAVAFVNAYTAPKLEEPPVEEPPVEEPPVIPELGENTSLLAWLALAFVSGATMFGTLKRKKRNHI